MTHKEFIEKHNIKNYEIKDGKLIIKEYANLSYNQLKNIPKGTVFKQYANLSHNQLKSIPEGTVFEGHANLSYNQLESISKGTIFKGNVYLFDFSISFRNDLILANKILKGELSFSEILQIENIEKRRIAYEHMDKTKILQEKNLKIIDEKIDKYKNLMKIISLETKEYDTPFFFFNCICPSTGREYMIETRETTCDKAKAKSFGFDELIFDEEW